MKKLLVVCGLIVGLGAALTVLASWVNLPASIYVQRAVAETGLPARVDSLSGRVWRLQSDMIARDTQIREEMRKDLGEIKEGQVELKTQTKLMYDMLKEKKK